jgi:hypothetical protein
MSQNTAKIDKLLGKNKIAATINEMHEIEFSIVVALKNSVKDFADVN